MPTCSSCGSRCRASASAAASDLDRWNSDLQEYLLRRRNTFVSLPTLHGTKWLRVILLNPFLTPEVVEEIFASIDAFAVGQ